MEAISSLSSIPSQVTASIIGGGPAGCCTAYLLAKAGKDVCLFEEHREIGSPVHCTGLVTQSLNNILRLKKEIIVNKIDRVKLFDGEKNFFELKLKNSNLLLDRKMFDGWLASLAAEEGARIFLNCRFIGNKQIGGKPNSSDGARNWAKKNIIGENIIGKNLIGKNIIKIRHSNKGEKELRTDYLIGADGPLSKVGRLNSIIKNRKFLAGIQATARLKNENCIEFYPSSGAFSWVVPESEESCRIGVASYDNPKERFRRFLKLKNIGDKDIASIQGGLIPIYEPRLKTKKGSIYLVGDAAAQLKATTGGGIIQALKASHCLADSIINDKDYEKEWKKEIGKDLLIHLKMRNVMDRFKEKDWAALIGTFKKEKTKKIIENFDRDYPTKFLLRLIVSEPRLLYFLRFLF